MSSSSSNITRLRDLSVVGQLAGSMVRRSRRTLGSVSSRRWGRSSGGVVMVRAVVGVVLSSSLLSGQVQGSLPVAAPSLSLAMVIIVVLMLSVFVIDYLCVSRLILL